MSVAPSRALLVCPRFFGYDRTFTTELERRGATVDFIPDRPFTSAAMMALARVLPERVQDASDRFYFAELDRLASDAHDLVLVINGQTISARVLREMRRRMPKARFVLYLWDSLRNRRSVVANLPLFDACFTFDPEDAREFGMHLRPLFFAPGYEQRRTDAELRHALSFVGTAHTDRYQIVRSIAESLPASRPFFRYLYLQAPWVYWAYRLSNPAFRRAPITDFHFTPAAPSLVHEAFAESIAILDIEHPRQTGLTMRTFESLGAEKKLVTTNARIREYEFYDPRNIAVVDRQAARVPAGLFDSPYVPLPPAIYERYSLRGWMSEVLG